MNTTEKALATIENLEYTLAQTQDVIVLKNLRDQAEAVRQYVRQAGQGLEMQNRVAELKIRVERKIGQFLNDVIPPEGGRPRKNPDTESQFMPRPTLAELGIASHQARRWRLQASLPEDIFEEFIDFVKKAGEELTSTGVRWLAQKWRQERQRQQQDEAQVGNETVEVETTSSLPTRLEPLYLDAYLSLWPGEAEINAVLTANTLTVTVYDGSQSCRTYILEPAEGYSLSVVENTVATVAIVEHR